MTYNETHHWKACAYGGCTKNADAQPGYALHSYDTNPAERNYYICKECEYENPERHKQAENMKMLYFAEYQDTKANKYGKLTYALKLKKNYPLASIQLNVTLPERVDTIDGGFSLGAMATDAELRVKKYEGQRKYNVQILGKGTGGSLKEFEGETGVVLVMTVKANGPMDNKSIIISNAIGSTVEAEEHEICDVRTVITNEISRVDLDATIGAVNETIKNLDRDLTDNAPRTNVANYLNGNIEKANTRYNGASCQYDVELIINDLNTAKNTAGNIVSDLLGLKEEINKTKSIKVTTERAQNYVNSRVAEAENVYNTSTDRLRIADTKESLKDVPNFVITLDKAIECYNIITAEGVKVYDDVHNPLYEALENAIDADPLVKDDLVEATENAWRQYYYDFVATDVIVYTNYLNKEVVREDDSDDATINAFKAALETATTTYGNGDIDLETLSATYKKAHEDLLAAFNALLEKQYANAKKALEAEIANANTAKGTLAYDENKTALQAYIDAAKPSQISRILRL